MRPDLKGQGEVDIEKKPFQKDPNPVNPVILVNAEGSVNG
jgi:hypothetical protein